MTTGVAILMALAAGAGEMKWPAQQVTNAAIQWQLEITAADGAETKYPWSSEDTKFALPGWTCASIVEGPGQRWKLDQWTLSVSCWKDGDQDLNHFLMMVVQGCIIGTDGKVARTGGSPLQAVSLVGRGDLRVDALITAQCRVTTDSKALERFIRETQALSAQKKAPSPVGK